MIKGSIYEINPTGDMVAVLTEHAEFSIFKLLGDDSVEKGDEVHWKNDIGLGPELLINITQREAYEVYFQNHWVSKDQLKQQLLF